MAENRKPAERKGRDARMEGQKVPPGLTHKDSDEWGSIADLLKSIENTNQTRMAKTKSPPPQQARMPPLTENIQSTDMVGMPNLMDLQKGQGIQQLNHLLRFMDQMCVLQRQNSKLREQAEYLSAIKNLHELRNETLLQNCHCDSHRRASDLSSSSGSRFEPMHATGESLSEPESQIGDDLDGDVPGRGEKRGRSAKREDKKSIKKRSRSLDPFGDEGDSKDRSKQGLFSKIEKMKEKLTNRRGSVKRRSNSRGDGAKSDDEGDEGRSGAIFHVDGLETKSEDSGIYHVGPEDMAAAARLESFTQKSTEDLSDNEDIFQGNAPPSWARSAVLAQSRRKGSDLSTESSSEDFLESKPKRNSPNEPHKQVTPQSSGPDVDDIAVRRSRFRRTTSCQDNVSFDEGDAERMSGGRSMGPVEEKLKHKRIQQSQSLDIEMTDGSGASEREMGRMSGSEFKHPQKRKYFRKAQVAENDEHSSSSVSIDGAFKDVRSPKASPPEKKKHRGWEKVKHAMSKKHLSETNRQKMMTSSTEESPPVAKRQEITEDGYLTPGDSTDDGSRKGPRREGAGPKKSQSQKREKGQLPLSKQSSLDSSSEIPPTRPSDLEAELNKGLTEEFSKKLAEWEKKKKTSYGATSPKTEPKQRKPGKEKKDSTKMAKEKEKQKTKESPLLTRRSKSPEAKVTRNIVVIEDEDGQLKLEGATKEFSKRFQEWEKMRSQSSLTSDSDSPSQRVKKQGSEDRVSQAPKKGRVMSDSVGNAATDATTKEVSGQSTPAQTATSQEAGSQSEFPDDSRAGDDAVFAEQDEHITKLEEKNTFLATQLKRKDVNLQAVQSELETMQHQLEQIGGSKRDLSHKRMSTCSSIGESLLEEELNDIKSQVEKLEQQYQRRKEAPGIPPLPPASASASSAPSCQTTSPLDDPTQEGTSPEDKTPDTGSEVIEGLEESDGSGVVDGCTSTDPLKFPEKTEAEVQTADVSPRQQGVPNEDLKRSLQQRENMIRLLQLELERQSQEISYLRNQGNVFKRAKSFSARDRSYNPVHMQSMDPIVGRNLGHTKPSKDSLSTLSISESTESRQDGSPSLETLHISAEDIRMDDDASKKHVTTDPPLASSSPTNSRTQTQQPQQVSEKQKQTSTKEDSEKRQYPGLYGPIETSTRRRRGNDVQEEGGRESKTEPTSSTHKEAEREADAPREESVEEMVARRRARREARRNIRLGITSNQDKPPLPETREDSKAPVSSTGRSAADKSVPPVASPIAQARVKDGVAESPRSRRRRDRQSGSQLQSPTAEQTEQPFKLPLSPQSKERQEREVFSDTTNDSEQESISLRSDSDIRRRFESILAHRRRESSDSVSSSRRSSPSTGRLYDSNFSRQKTNGDVQNLRKKFSGSTGPSAVQAGPVKQKSKSLKYEKERPREGSVKALSQAFTESTEEKKGAGGGSTKTSPQSLSPASSSGSLSTGIAEKIKRLKSPPGDEKPLERRKSADLIKARVAQLQHSPGEKTNQSETEHRKSTSAIQATRNKFERNASPEPSSATPKKISGRISYTVSVTDSDKENSESSRLDDRSSRQKSKSSRLAAVTETPSSQKKQDTVTYTVSSHGRRRHGMVADNKNNSNSKQSEPEVKEVPTPLTDRVTEKTGHEEVKSSQNTKDEQSHSSTAKEQEGNKDKGGRRRRRERQRAAAQEEQKKEDASKTDATTREPPKTEAVRDVPQEKESSQKRADEPVKAKDVEKPESGKKSRRRSRQKKAQAEEAVSQEAKKIQETAENQEEERKTEKKYEKKEDVTKPSERHIQKKDKESTLTALKRMVSKREDTKPEVKVRDPAKSRLEAENKSSSIDSAEGQDYPDLLAQTRQREKDKGNTLEEGNGNGKRRPRSMVAESGLKGAAAAIGHPLPKQTDDDEEQEKEKGKDKEKEKEKDKAKEEEEDDRRSRKETGRRGRFLSKADKLNKLDLFRRARSVGPGKAKDRSPSAERKSSSKGIRSSSMDRSKKASRAKSPDPVKSSKKKGGSIGGFLKASKTDEALDSFDESGDSEYDDGDDDDEANSNDLWSDLEECYRIVFDCHSVLTKLELGERRQAFTWPMSVGRQAAMLS
ncbi:uncharacterized protein [Diadema setosum]|uniref:uncharacterized protein n=1 Tax=Diadema setosum TaxID=31175 RepID=UPI003B3A49C5